MYVIIEPQARGSLFGYRDYEGLRVDAQSIAESTYTRVCSPDNKHLVENITGPASSKLTLHKLAAVSELPQSSLSGKLGTI